MAIFKLRQSRTDEELQLTLPESTVKDLGIEPGDHVTFVEDDKGNMTVAKSDDPSTPFCPAFTQALEKGKIHYSPSLNQMIIK